MKLLIFACLVGIAVASANLALKRPTVQFDTRRQGGKSSFAVDGNRETNFYKHTCTHTNANAKDLKNKNWWAVDLGDFKKVSKVVITNRGDCCSERLANFEIVLLNEKPVAGKQLNYKSCNVCHTHKAAVGKGQRISIPCKGEGRYVAIVQPRAQFLTLCEVEVY